MTKRRGKLDNDVEACVFMARKVWPAAQTIHVAISRRRVVGVHVDNVQKIAVDPLHPQSTAAVRAALIALGGQG